MKRKVNKYNKAGVNIDEGNNFIKLIKKKVFATHTKGAVNDLNSFAGFFDLSILKYKNPLLISSADGVGTKIKIAQDLKKYNSIGIDLVAMCINDILVHGGKPIFFLDYIAVEKLNKKIALEIVDGISKGCKEANCSILGGETAEMPDTYLPGEHDIVGIITGVVEKEKIITGENIKPGDVVLGLPSSGLHTNGYSFARKLFFEIGGYDVNDTIPELEKSVGLTLLEPHINYTNHVFSVLDKCIDVKGIAHITGGGLVENIPRILPDGCGVEIKKGSWPSLPVFDVMQFIGDVDEEEMYRAFNIGIGMVVRGGKVVEIK